MVALEKLVYDLSRCAERKLDRKILSRSRASRITFTGDADARSRVS